MVLPGLFMLLLVWIKSLTTVFDSPTAAYTCGQTIPWQYEKRLPKNPVELLDNPLIKCLQQPPSCTEKNYYRDEGGVFEQIGMDGVRKKCRTRAPDFILVDTRHVSRYYYTLHIRDNQYGPATCKRSMANCHPASLNSSQVSSI